MRLPYIQRKYFVKPRVHQTLDRMVDQLNYFDDVEDQIKRAQANKKRRRDFWANFKQKHQEAK
jgi:hypothetical protein